MGEGNIYNPYKLPIIIFLCIFSQGMSVQVTFKLPSQAMRQPVRATVEIQYLLPREGDPIPPSGVPADVNMEQSMTAVVLDSSVRL